MEQQVLISRYSADEAREKRTAAGRERTWSWRRRRAKPKELLAVLIDGPKAEEGRDDESVEGPGVLLGPGGRDGARGREVERLEMRVEWRARRSEREGAGEEEVERSEDQGTEEERRRQEEKDKAWVREATNTSMSSVVQPQG